MKRYSFAHGTTHGKAAIAAMCILSSVITASAVAAPMPPDLAGLWQAADRYVLFDNLTGSVSPTNTATGSGNAGSAADKMAMDAVAGDLAAGNIAVALRVYDKWYCDRAAEPLEYSGEPLSYREANRTRNSATTAEAEHITTMLEPIAPGAWEMRTRYGARAVDNTAIPVAVIGGQMYLDFAVQVSGTSFYQGVRAQTAIRTCPMPVFTEHPRPRGQEIACYYAAPDAVYRLRYWSIDIDIADKSDRMVTFADGGAEYSVPAQIVSVGMVFTCVTGRGRRVRNTQKLPAAFLSGARTSDGSVVALGLPAMTRVEGTGDRQAFFDAVAAANKRRAPSPKPLLPPSSADWHMDAINNLEAGNPVIQAVRERSREFMDTGGRAARADVESAMQDNSRLKPDWSDGASALY